jgi:hypothetical protein
MIFTTGFAYFMFVQYNYQLQHQAAIERNQMDFEQSLEQFEISGTLDTNNFIHVVVNNTGPVTVQIVYLFVNSTIKTIDLTSNPVTVNSGSFASINSTQKYTIGEHYILKVVTARGNIASCQYPPPPSPEAQIALIAKGVGPILVEFVTFKWYSFNVTDLNGKTLPPESSWKSGWSVKAGLDGIIWRVTVINHDLKDIYLNKNSLLSLIAVSQTQPVAWYWYIVNVTNSKIYSYKGLGTATDGSIKIPANPNDPAEGGTPITIYFASTEGPSGTISKKIPSGQTGINSVFITLQGKWSDGQLYAQTLIPIIAIEVT